MEESTAVNLVMNLASLAVGFLIAAMSLWWSYKTRTSPHREFLYERQIEAYGESVKTMQEYALPVLASLDKYENKLTAETRQSILEQINLHYLEYTRVERKMWPILPIDVAKELFRVSAIINSYASGVGEHASPEDPMKYLEDALARTYNMMRKSAGVQPLSEEMQEVFGRR